MDLTNSKADYRPDDNNDAIKYVVGFLRYSKKPNAVSLRIISSVNMLVKTMLQISRTLVSSSGWVGVGWVGG